MYKRNTLLLSRNHCYSRKALSITYSEWVPIAFVINHALRVPHVISVARLVVPFHKGHYFCRQVVEHEMCFDSLYNFYLEHFLFQEELSETLS